MWLTQRSAGATPLWHDSDGRLRYAPVSVRPCHFSRVQYVTRNQPDYVEEMMRTVIEDAFTEAKLA
jgi:hypothetical protein